MQVPSILGSACEISKIPARPTHVWKGIPMRIERKLCHLVVTHVKDMLHCCQHALVEQGLAIPKLFESSAVQLWYPQTQQNIRMLFP